MNLEPQSTQWCLECDEHIPYGIGGVAIHICQPGRKAKLKREMLKLRGLEGMDEKTIWACVDVLYKCL